MSIEILDKGACRAAGFVSTDQAVPICRALGIVSADYSGGVDGIVDLTLEQAVNPERAIILTQVQLIPFTAAGPVRAAMIDQSTLRIETYDTAEPPVLQPKQVYFMVFSLDGMGVPTIIPPPP